MRDVRPSKVELGHGGGGGLGRITDRDAPGGRKIKGTLETASENVRRGNASLGELIDAVGRLGRGERRVSASLDRGLTQQIHIGGSLVRVGLDDAHRLVEVRGNPHRVA